MFNLNPTPEEYHEAWLDLPFRSPAHARSPGEAMLIPGCCLKTIERLPSGWSKHFGRLVSIDRFRDTVLVISYPHEKDTRFIWTGTVAEYTAVWDCD